MHVFGLVCVLRGGEGWRGSLSNEILRDIEVEAKRFDRLARVNTNLI